MLASLTSWLTPSSLFLLLNIVIGTIVITSRFTSSRRQQYHHYYHQPGPDYGAPPLARAPSLLERVRSFDFSFYNYGHPNYETPFVHAPEQQYIVPPPQLERVPSILERIKSTDFFHKFGYPNHDVPFVHPSETEHTAPPPPLERTPSLLDRVKSINFSLYKFAPSYPESDHVLHPDPQYEAAPQQPDFPQLTRTPSLLERVRSIDFTSFYRSDSLKKNPETELIPPAAEWDSGTDSVRDPVHVNRSKSEKNVTQRRLPEKIKKSASENSRQNEEVVEEIERRRPATTRLEKTVSIGEKGDVDAKADDFINRFRQNLKLQRLDSILRRKETPKGE
ncbi:hypothetical protein SLEP1_g24939 [Rubroshorea leprosula]|uniref:DUF4408 domain-containing protein n=1 Tax=Rubroshorea leprosula TaxID=152421 RepID=A0AAV5JPI1_9ROSI|nr:hypothetical protein SLEP1_g24939 [Rubroshorea leprosula]